MEESKVSGPGERKSTAQKTTSSAIASLVLGILSFFIGPLVGIPAIICGHIARGAVKKNPSELKGRGLAMAGLVMGYYTTVMFLLFISLIISVLFAIRMYKEAEEAEIAKLRQENPAIVVQTETVPVIDGKEDEIWNTARRYEITNVIPSDGSGESLTRPTSSNDLSGNFRAMWDEDNLYLLVEVTDDTLVNDTSPNEWVIVKSGSNVLPWWFDDCVEVYIDADNSKDEQYDDGDAQYHFDWDRKNPTMDRYNHGRTENIEFATVTTKNGYRVEIKFPWVTLGVKPVMGMIIGLDVQVNDDDNGGERDSKISWHGKDDTAWENPRVFGNAKLTGCGG